MKTQRQYYYGQLIQRMEYNPRLFLILLIWGSVAVFAYQFALTLTSQWMVAGMSVAAFVISLLVIIWPFQGIMLFMGLSIWHYTFVRGGTVMGLGSALVYPVDLFVVCFLASEFFRGCTRQTRLYGPTDRWVLAFFVWTLACVLRGIPEYKNSAYGESREFIAAIAYFVTIHCITRVEQANKSVKWMMWIAIITSILQVFYFVFVNQFRPRIVGGGPLAIFGSMNLVVLGVLLGRDHITERMSALPIAAALGCAALGGVLYYVRNFVAEEATIWVGLPIGVCVVAAVALILQYRVAAVVALMFQFALVLCSAQRSPTMAVLATIPLLLWIGRRHFMVSLVLLVLSLGIFFGWLELMNPTLGGKLIPFMEKQFTAFLSPEMDPTGSWRLYGWRWELNKVFSNPFWVLIGQGFGGYYEWYFTLTDEVIRTAPHNVYIQLWSKQGLVGLGLYIVILISFFKQGFQFLIRSRNEMRRSIMMILMLVIFGNVVNQVGGQFVVGSWVIMALGTILPRLWLAEQPAATVAHSSITSQAHPQRVPIRSSLRMPPLASQRSRV